MNTRRYVTLCTLATSWLAIRAAAASDSLPSAARTLDPPARPGSMSPAWVLGATPPQLTWLEPAAEGGTAVRIATLEGGRWLRTATITSGKGLFSNWADFPTAAVAPDGTYFAHWLEKNGESTYAYGIELAQSRDRGQSWRRLGRLHDDATEAEHGFVSWVTDGRALRAVWLDGRATPSGGAMALRTALLGASIGPSTELDARVCDCCQTTAVATAKGPLVAFRDRSAEEVRDISVVRRIAGQWTAAVPLAVDGWKIPGCPVNGPRAGAQGDNLAVAWFTGAPERGGQRVQVAFSSDAGASFSAPTVLDRDAPLGRVDLVLAPDGSAVVSWLANAAGKGAVTLRRVRPDGTAGAPLVLAETSAGRGSGFPRLRLEGRELLVAWVEVGDDRSTSILRTAALPLASLSLP